MPSLMKHYSSIGILFVGLCSMVHSDRHLDIGAARAEMSHAALDFLGTLGTELREKAAISFDSENRHDWGYVPRGRKGISLKELSQTQREAAMNLLRKALSSKGYDKATGVILLESVLAEIEGSWRDPGLYFVSVFGSPSATEPWGWRVEGHHLSLNFTSVTGEVIAATPAFYGSNPAIVRKGAQKDLRVLGYEEDLARELLSSMSSAQRQKAVFSNRAPSEIVSGVEREIDPGTPKGLPVSEMTAEQRGSLMRLIEEYVGNIRPEFADGAMARIGKAGIEKIYFAWAGGEKKGEGHYYRIQGPTFLIEYDNTQNNANHIHSVWRDLENDFGADLLRRHYKEHPH